MLLVLLLESLFDVEFDLIFLCVAFEFCALLGDLVHKLLLRREEHHPYVFETLVASLGQLGDRRQMIHNDGVLLLENALKSCDRTLKHLVDDDQAL